MNILGQALPLNNPVKAEGVSGGMMMTKII